MSKIAVLSQVATVSHIAVVVRDSNLKPYVTGSFDVVAHLQKQNKNSNKHKKTKYKRNNDMLNNNERGTEDEQYSQEQLRTTINVATENR